MAFDKYIMSTRWVVTLAREQNRTGGWGLAKPIPFYSIGGVVVDMLSRLKAAWCLLRGRGVFVVYGRYEDALNAAEQGGG